MAQTEKINASFFARKQSIGDGYSPFSQSFAVQTPFSFQKMGIGILVTNETFFIEQKLAFTLAYAYKINLGNGYLSFGLGAGIRQMRIDFENLSKREETNAISNSLLFPHFETGILYKTKNYYLGLSLKNLQSNRFVFDSENKLNYTYKPNLFLTGAYKLELNESFVIIPSFLMQKTNGLSLHLDMSTHFKFNSKAWLGSTVRTSPSVAFQVGIKLDEYIKYLRQGITIGYAFEYGYGISSKFNTSHEIMLLMDFEIHKSVTQIKKKKIMVSPLFF